MEDHDKKYLYISGTFLMMTVSSSVYVVRTYQVLGKQLLNNTNGQVFLGGTILFAIAAIIAFYLYLRSKAKE